MAIKKRFAGIRDVAGLAGVSIATVSRVINSPESTSPKTREKVLKAIKECGYIPNPTARSLLNDGISRTIAFFVPDISNPYYICLMRHLNRITFDSGYNLIVCETEYSLKREKQYYDYCKSIRAGGIIYTVGTTRRNFELDSQASIPLVLMDRSNFKDVFSYSIISDNRKALRLLIDYLFHLNHRKIGFIGGDACSLSGKERYEGFCHAMERHSLDVLKEYVLFSTFAEESGIHAFDYFYSLPDPPTAIVASSDQMAQGFIMRANSLGVNIPNEFSICGIDAVDCHFYPKITSIRQNIELIAQMAFDYIKNADKNPPPANEIIDVSLCVGQTCRKLPS